MNPTGRFTGLANLYARHRPEYPPAAVDFVCRRCGLGPGSVLVDVGSGTGIASRQFARVGFTVIGIEPNDEMRREAGRVVFDSGIAAPVYRPGRAEATGLPDATADAVLAAQAFHWFDPEPTLREFHRILTPAGWVVLLWNERDEADPFTAAYGAIVRATPEGPAAESGPRRRGDPLLTSILFQKGERTCFAHQQALDEDGLLGRALSASYAPREPAQVEEFIAALRATFVRFQRDGRVALQYQTVVVLAQRRDRV
jgi:SAM-dependent methyltransferase